MPKALSDDEKAQIAYAIKKGDKSRNELARMFNRSVSTITKIARAVGHDFDRSHSKAATEALKADARARRAVLSQSLLASAEKMAAAMFEPAKVRNWYQGKMYTRTVPQPPYVDQKNIAITVAILVDKHEQLERIDSGDEDEVRGALRTLMAAVKENAYA